jgi:uncharacterized protein (TIGR03083 family)
MEEFLDFPVLLRMIDERSAAFRAAIASAPSLETKVPTCPEWTLADLVGHLGEVHRFWAAVVAAGPADAVPGESAAEASGAAPREREALLAWSAESTKLLLAALREAGPDRGCWTWWARSESPQTCGAVARHQVQEAMVHAYDAEITVDVPQTLPEAPALDGVDEFLATCCAGEYAWPFGDTTVDYHATEGRSWRLSLAADGVRVTRSSAADVPGSDGAADASARGTAADLVLTLYGRIPIDSLQVDGDRRLFDRLRDWDPDA